MSAKLACVPVPSALKTRAVLSNEAVTMRDPSGLNDAELTRSYMPGRRMGTPLPSAFHPRGLIVGGGDNARSRPG